MTTPCPTDLALERHLLDPVASPQASHVAACPSCRARIARMEEDGERFRRFVFPATVDRIEEAARRRPARWWIALLAPVPVLAAVVAVVLAVRPVGPAEDYLGLKGAGGLGLTAFARDASGPRAVPDGGSVPASAALRLRVRASAPCRLFVLSLDARGAVSRLDAGGAEGFPLEAGQHDLPGGVELDGAGGPERLFAVCAPAGLAWPEVERAGRAAAEGGAGAVRGASRLGGLPAGAAQATLLLEKSP
jgi:hypothetical protein